jgi:hypothetical protein
MHPMQARVGVLLVVSGAVLAFALQGGLTVVVGPALLVAGGLVLALAAEPLLAEPLVEEHAPADEVTEPAEPPEGMVA